MTPATKLNTTDWKIPTDIKLADEHFYQPGNIDLLIGADFFYEISRPGRRTRPGLTVLQERVLGWTIAGRTPANTTVKEVRRAFLQREPHITDCKLGRGPKLKFQDRHFMKKHEETSQKLVKFQERTEIYYFRPHHPVSKEIRSTSRARFVSGGSDKPSISNQRVKRKWASNHSKFLDTIPRQLQVKIDSATTVKDSMEPVCTSARQTATTKHHVNFCAPHQRWHH